MLIATTTVTITAPAGDGDPYEAPASTATIAAGLPAHISAPSGSDARIGGAQETVDAVLLCDALLERAMIVADDTTGERYTVTWARRRTGLGLDHTKAGLVAVKGGANG